MTLTFPTKVLALCALVLSSFTFTQLNDAQAQSLDLRLDSSVSSGLILGPAGRETSLGRSPLLLDFDAAFIFDGDRSVEWVLGSLIQMEYTPAVAFNPQVRIRRQKGLFEGFAGVGVPFYVAPLTRFGTELSLGFSFPTNSPVALVANVSMSSYFLGSDLPDDSAVFLFNGAVGVRLTF